MSLALSLPTGPLAAWLLWHPSLCSWAAEPLTTLDLRLLCECVRVCVCVCVRARARVFVRLPHPTGAAVAHAVRLTHATASFLRALPTNRWRMLPGGPRLCSSGRAGGQWRPMCHQRGQVFLEGEQGSHCVIQCCNLDPIGFQCSCAAQQPQACPHFKLCLSLRLSSAL